MSRQDFGDLEKFANQIQGASKRPLLDFYDEVIRLLAKENIALAGGLALSAHGIVRMTEDLDLVAVATNGIEEKLMAAGFIRSSAFSLNRGGLEIVRYMKDDRLLDLMLYTDKALVSELLDNAKPATVLGQKLNVLSADGLALTKLISFRPQDFADLVKLAPKLNREYLTTWAKKLKIPADRIVKTFKEAALSNYPTLKKILT